MLEPIAAGCGFKQASLRVSSQDKAGVACQTYNSSRADHGEAGTSQLLLPGRIYCAHQCCLVHVSQYEFILVN